MELREASADGWFADPRLTPLLSGAINVLIRAINTMLETKFLRLRTPVELGSRFDDWQVCWLGGWSRYRLFYLVMLVKIKR
jgi:hypothetical protein